MKNIITFNKKLGFGGLRYPKLKDDTVDFSHTSEMLDKLLENGFNFFDTAYLYDGSEETLKRCLTSRHERDEYMLCNKLAWGKDDVSYEDMFATSLERCGVDYFDVYLLHGVSDKRHDEEKLKSAFDFIRNKKETGKVKHIGFSFHGTAPYLDEVLSEHTDVEVVLLQINYIDWDSPTVQSKGCYEVAKKHGVPIMVMEPVKGGNLAVLNEKAQSVFDALDSNASASSYAIRYVASLPGVDMVLSGMSNMEQIKDNIGYMKNFTPLSDDEKEAVEKVKNILNSLWSLPCTNCGYCINECPQKIAIPKIFDLYKEAKNSWDASLSKSKYEEVVAGGGRAGDCIKCKACEYACPQNLCIVDYLEEISSMFD